MQGTGLRCGVRSLRHGLTHLGVSDADVGEGIHSLKCQGRIATLKGDEELAQALRSWTS